MTQACVVVIAAGRRVLLHTRHSGMEVPKLIPRVFDMVADRWRPLMRKWDTSRTDRDELLDLLESVGVFAPLESASSVAALLIAAKPFLLEPLTVAGRKDLPSASGIKTPYVLRVARGRWRFYDENGALVSNLDYQAEDHLRLHAQNKRGT